MEFNMQLTDFPLKSVFHFKSYQIVESKEAG